MKSRIRLVATIAAAAVGLTIVPTDSIGGEASDPLVFQASIGYCFSGQGPGDADIRITWRDRDGILKARFTVQTSSGSPGYWSAPFEICDDQPVEPLDTIRARVLPPHAEQTRTFVVERLKVTFDRRTDVVAGRAPANSTVDMSVLRCGLFGCFLFPPEMCDPATVNVDASGRFARDLTNCGDSGYDAIGGDLASIAWTSPMDDTVSRDVLAQFARFSIFESRVAGAIFPMKDVTIQARRPNGTLRGTMHDTAGLLGRFSGVLRNTSGQQVRLRIGDHVSGDWAGPVSFVIPNMLLILQGKDVSGSCMPNVPWAVRHLRGDTGAQTNGGVTDANGNIQAFTLGQEPVSGDIVSLRCQRRSGDQVQVQLFL